MKINRLRNRNKNLKQKKQIKIIGELVMKTTNNAQEKVKGQVSKFVLRGGAVIISLVLLSWTVGAQEFWEQVITGYNYGKMAILRVEVPSTTPDAIQTEQATETDNSLESTFEALEAELSLQVEEYNATEFVEAELATETENWMNNNAEAIEAELTLQVEEYNATEFAEVELATETENWMNSNAEAMEVKLKEIMKFNAAEYVEAELAAETENWMNRDTESNNAELTLKIDVYNAAEFAEAELAIEAENWKNNNTEINFEAIETVLSLPVQVYNAREFAEADLAKETEIWLKKNEMSTEDQLFPDQKTETKIERYASK